MLRRNALASSASGAHVFPGGVLDAVDTEVVERGLVVGLGADDAAHRLELSGGALAFYCAALRELFEEAGLLMAVDDDGRTVNVTRERLTGWRHELASSNVSWPDFLEHEGLRLDVSGVHFIGHWVTPEGRSRRFDTRFFVASAPPYQSALPDYGEVVEHVWTTAALALERCAAGEWQLLVPTLRTLDSLSAHRDVEGVLAAAATSKVTRIQPREISRDGRTVVVAPGDPGYDL